MFLEHRLDLSSDRSGDRSVLGRTLSRRHLPRPSGVETTAGHAQLPAQPGDRVLLGQLLDQAKPFGDTSLSQSALPPA
jgi:hypothetical protein